MAQDYSNLSDNDLKALYNDDYSSISDEGLKTLYNSDTNSNETSSTTLKGGVSKKVDLRPHNVINNALDTATAALTTPLNMLTKRNDLKTAYDEERQSLKDIKTQMAIEHPILTNFENGVKDLAVYSMLPAANIFKVPAAASKLAGLAKAGNMAATGAYQGGLIGGLESLANTGDLSGAKESAAIGGALGGAFPIIGGAYNNLKKAASPLVGKITGLKPETLERAVQPDSMALDLTKDQSENLLANITERVRDNYNQLLNKAGENVSSKVKALNNQEQVFLADDLKKDINSIFNKYQGDRINPARNMTGSLESDLLSLIDNAKIGKPLYNFKPETLQAVKNIINGSNEEIVLNMRNDLEKLGGTNDISIIFGNDKKGLQHIANAHGKDIVLKVIDAVENGKIDKFVPAKKTVHLQKDDIEAILSLDEHGKTKSWILTGWNKKSPDVKRQVSTNLKTTQTKPTFSRQDLGAELNNIVAQNEQHLNSVSPLDLQKIKEQVGHTINWQDEAARNYKNPVLEQLYGRYMERLNTLSPELEKANKLYSYLRNFKKNEGLRRVLKAGDNIDTASSALKNYKNTITKGNTRRNINDLERVLAKAGYKPFLNQIDDINAAQDLQNSLPTGINFLGANNLLKGAIALGLRGQRALNRSNLPAIYEQLILSHPELRIPLLYTGSNTIFNSEE